jgi:hypothetical protein
MERQSAHRGVQILKRLLFPETVICRLANDTPDPPQFACLARSASFSGCGTEAGRLTSTGTMNSMIDSYD